eukprot:6001349-Amphidinium_carterae.1
MYNVEGYTCEMGQWQYAYKQLFFQIYEIGRVISLWLRMVLPCQAREGFQGFSAHINPGQVCQRQQ